MKRRILFGMLIFCLMKAYTQIPEYFYFQHYMDSEDYYYKQGSLYEKKGNELIRNYQNTIRLNDLGFVYSTYNGEEFLILGNRISFNTKMFFPVENVSYNITDENNYLKLLIKSIKAPDSLCENVNGKKIDYKIDNLLQSFEIGCKELPYDYNTNCLPWVSKRTTVNIGQKIEVEFFQKQKGIQILNGYVNIFHQQYYHNNNRIKEIKIFSKDSNSQKVYNLNDVAIFQNLEFEKPAKSIVIEIVSVYPGEKYNDTCIGSIFVY